MKQLIFTTFIIAAIISDVHAQRATIQYSGYEYKDNGSRFELRALQNFENQLDQFSYSMMVGDVWLAQKMKAAIIRSMQSEIRKTRSQLNALSGNGHSYSRKYRQRDYRSGNRGVYSKRNGNRSYRVNRLIDQLEEQKWIKYRFENTNLLRPRRRGIINERKHRTFMYQFRDIMRENLEYTRSDRRG